MLKMKADVGDLVYLCDSRKWLGGLKSIHSVYGEPHDTDGVVMITNNQQQSGLFDQNRKLFGEKEMSEVSKKLNAPFMMTSAKDGRNVGEAFQNISESMVEGM